MLVVRWQQPAAGRLAAAAAPFAAVVELADDPRGAHAFLPVVELLLDLVFDHLAFLLDDEDLLQAFRKSAGTLRLERPGEGDLVNAQAYVVRDFLGDAEIVKRPHYVAEGLAARHDAEARA